MLRPILLGLAFALITLSATQSAVAKDVQDPCLWLEDIDGEQSMDWVRAANAETDKRLSNDALYREIYADALSALNTKDKLPKISVIGDLVYTLKKDADHPRGVYQRTSLNDFKSANEKWETVLDIDAMSEKDNIKWVFHGMDCLKPENQKCLVYLSPGGGDAHEMKEFNAKTLKFVDNGFSLPAAKMQVSWMDEDHLFVATDFGAGSQTDSGYARRIKIWQRATKLDQAKQIFEVSKQSVFAGVTRYKNKDQNVDLLADVPTYWTRSYHQLIDGKAVSLRLPETAIILDMIAGNYLVSLKEDWSVNDQVYGQGSALLIPPSTLVDGKGSIVLLVESKPSAIVENVMVAKDSIIVTVLEDVKSKVYRYSKTKDGWQSDLIDLPHAGQIVIAAISDTTGDFFARYEGFITPPTLYAVGKSLIPTLVRQQSATFDASNLSVNQFFAESLDGTRVPYFVVMNQNTKLDGTNPTHIFAYGGFRVSLTPSYSGSYEDLNGVYGKAWLERGGVYVIANIRGGAEYGPSWHAAALLENRHKAFEDFEAIAEDLFKRKITSAKHLGIEGRSNGGLLVGATMVRRPELYGAIICGVPLLDMKRYSKLLAGASWMAEYGDPDTDDWSFIKQYSPYQNLKKGQSYPPIFFFTSTKDDRVHPGHARKMAAKMKASGNQVDYYENVEGGHKGSATAEQTAKRVALSFTHLWKHLQ
ncbi:MAG: S9 family peptidase [Arenicella sp.]|nr:S9 family peptidase [Arenicella sp.]